MISDTDDRKACCDDGEEPEQSYDRSGSVDRNGGKPNIRRCSGQLSGIFLESLSNVRSSG